jgi:hypothetical protein
MTLKSKFYADANNVFQLIPNEGNVFIKKFRSEAAAIRYADKLQKAHDKAIKRDSWNG